MKQIPILLKSHLQQTVTTYCFLVKIECKGSYEGRVIGFTNLDDSITYDDGEVTVTYVATNGFTPSALESDSEMNVDNAQLTGWVNNTGVTEEEILSGIFDYAKVTIYRVNYMELSMGHEVVGYGTCGETKFTDQSWSTEWRSIAQQAKQVIGQIYSLTCRAKFGDERCKMPFIWTTATVSGEATRNRAEFFADAIAQPEGYYDGGVVEWLTGPNAGAQMEVDEFADTGSGRAIRLILPMPYPIEAGHTFMIRRDCDKHFTTCQAYGNHLNFRGEHLTPVADTSLSVPGANIRSVGAQ